MEFVDSLNDGQWGLVTWTSDTAYTRVDATTDATVDNAEGNCFPPNLQMSTFDVSCVSRINTTTPTTSPTITETTTNGSDGRDPISSSTSQATPTTLSSTPAADSTGSQSSDQCMICEYVGVASSEENAIAMLEGSAVVIDGTTDVTDVLIPCAVGSRSNAFDEAIAADFIKLDNQNSEYCTAKFFIYHAKDINRFVYGVIRSVANSKRPDSQIQLRKYSKYLGPNLLFCIGSPSIMY